MAEWSMAAVLKTVSPKGDVGSNPTPSATPWVFPAMPIPSEGARKGIVDPWPFGPKRRNRRWAPQKWRGHSFFLFEEEGSRYNTYDRESRWEGKAGLETIDNWFASEFPQGFQGEMTELA
jgi:hypothetical protein